MVVISGERRLTSIKALIESMTLKLVQPFVTTTTITNNPVYVQTYQQVMTAKQTATNVSNVSVLIAAANANRKRLLIRNQDSSTGKIYLNFTGGPALTTDLLVSARESYELPEGVTFTGAIYCISDSATAKTVHVLEWSV